MTPDVDEMSAEIVFSSIRAVVDGWMEASYAGGGRGSMFREGGEGLALGLGFGLRKFDGDGGAVGSGWDVEGRGSEGR